MILRCMAFDSCSLSICMQLAFLEGVIVAEAGKNPRTLIRFLLNSRITLQ